MTIQPSIGTIARTPVKKKPQSRAHNEYKNGWGKGQEKEGKREWKKEIGRRLKTIVANGVFVVTFYS